MQEIKHRIITESEEREYSTSHRLPIKALLKKKISLPEGR